MQAASELELRRGRIMTRHSRFLESALARYGLLPQNFTLGGLRDGQAPRGMLPGGGGLPPEVVDALVDFRAALRFRVPIILPQYSVNFTAAAAAPAPPAAPPAFPWWPFQHCNRCHAYAPDAHNATYGQPLGTPWWQWPEARQRALLGSVFRYVASQQFKIVSDEFYFASLMEFYNLTGPAWVTEGPSSHVDWSRATGDGHPGTYGRRMILRQHDQMLQVRACMPIAIASRQM